MIPYPFQKNFDQLSDPAIVAECQSGLQRIGSEPATSLDQHLELQYGAGIAQHFLRPYNEKLWGPDLSRLTVDWTAERIVGLHNAPKHFSAQGGARTPLQANTQVAYPAQGGYGEIFRALAAKLPQLRFDESVIRIDTDKHILSTAKGECLPWHRIISTLPLPALLKLLPNVPAPLLRRSNQLVALPLNLVLLSLNNQLDTRIQRVYCAGKEMPGHKIVLNHNSSTYLNRLPQHGIMVEVSAHHGSKPVPEKQLCEQIVSGLLKIRLLQGREQINNMRVIALAYGYPVPTHGRAEVVADIKQWLAGQGIYSVGRFGEWAYINADEALYRGLRLGAELAQAT
jgi:protoporphyrinogen oxidase